MLPSVLCRANQPVLQVAVAAQQLPDHDVHGLLEVATPLLSANRVRTIQIRLSGDDKHHALRCGSTTNHPAAAMKLNPAETHTAEDPSAHREF